MYRTQKTARNYHYLHVHFRVIWYLNLLMNCLQVKLFDAVLCLVLCPNFYFFLSLKVWRRKSDNNNDIGINIT